MLTRVLKPLSKLLHTPLHPFYIYLKDHQQKINPPRSRLNLQYNNPKNIHENIPAQRKYKVTMGEQTQQYLERQIFEVYKRKLLKGKIDQEVVQQPDPLWGEEEVPVHYYEKLCKSDLMAVSAPQNADFEPILQEMHSPYFKATQIDAEITKQYIQNCNISQIPNIALLAKQNKILNGQMWFWIEDKLQRGQKLYQLSYKELIFIKYAFEGIQKFGTPIFDKILSNLLKEDLKQMGKQDLVSLFFACRFSRKNKENIQKLVIQKLAPHMKTMTCSQKINFLFTFTLSSKNIKYDKKIHLKKRHQFKNYANNLIFMLDFWKIDNLNNELVQKMIYSLAKLRVPNTKFITKELLKYIEQNYDDYVKDNKRLVHAVSYLPELEDGEGMYTIQLFEKFRSTVMERWQQFDKTDQLRLLHSFWNLHLFEPMIQLYKQTQMDLNTTHLYYFCQIQLQTSSQRQWQIIHLISALPFVPLPYFKVFKRFYNYIKNTTDWNLKVIQEKLKNTEYYYDVYRQKDGFYNVRSFREFEKFQKFFGGRAVFSDCPIQNVDIVMYGYPQHQVSLDIVNARNYVIGTKKLKNIYQNKVRSLQNVAWKHTTIDEGQLKSNNLENIYKFIRTAFEPHIEEQKQVKAYEQAKRSQQIQSIREEAIINEMTPDELSDFYNYGDEDYVPKIKEDRDSGDQLGQLEKAQAQAES